MFNLFVTLPLQFACQLIGPGNSSYGNFTIIQNISASSQQPAQQWVLPDGYTAFEDIGLAYKYYHSTVATWNEARRSCIAEGAVLAVLDSFKKIGYALTVKKTDAAPHVGIHRTYDKIEWTSVKTTLAVSSIPWAPEPDLNRVNFDCAALYPDGRGLAARDCKDRRGYICEIQIPNNNTQDERLIALIPN